MKTKWLQFAGIALLVVFGDVSLSRGESGIIAGWKDLTGRELLGELGCVACHTTDENLFSMPPKTAPRLRTVGRRIRQ